MSTGNKKAFKKIKKITEKDKRMAQLEKEIARLEQENGKLKRDSVEYKNRLAAFDGATRFDPDFSKLNPGSQTVAGNRFTPKSRENFNAASPSKNVAGNGIFKKKLRGKTIKNLKKTEFKWQRKASCSPWTRST